MKLILTSKKDIKSNDYPKLDKSIRYIKLRPLNDIEAVDMILSNCNREITNDELMLTSNSRRNIHTQLQ